MAFCLFVHMCTCFDGVYWLPVLVKQYNNAAVYDSPERSSDLNLALNMNVPPTMLNPGIIWGYRILSGPLLKYNVKL